MVFVIFEVWPHPEHRAGYLDWAAELKNELVKMEGFISIERFQSLTDSDKSRRAARRCSRNTG